MYKVFLNTLVATSWNAFAGDIAVKSRDAIKLHQEKYNANSVIPHNVLASDYLTDCHQALFFQQDTRSALKKIDFYCVYKFFFVVFKSQNVGKNCIALRK